MDRETVIRQLRAWADGVDPTSGEALPPDHPGQRPDTLRVIFAALALLDDTAGSDVSRRRPSIDRRTAERRPSLVDRGR